MRKPLPWLLIGCLLIGLLLWRWCRYVHPFPLDAATVTGIRADVTTGSLDSRAFDLDDPGQIRTFCRLWNAMYCAPVPPYEDRFGTRSLSGENSAASVEIAFADGSTAHYVLDELYVIGAMRADPQQFYIWGVRDGALSVVDYLAMLEQGADTSDPRPRSAGMQLSDRTDPRARFADVQSIEVWEYNLKHQRLRDEITDRDTIDRICEVYAAMHLERLPEGYTFSSTYSGVSTAHVTRGRFVFHLADGSTVTVDNPVSPLLAIDGVWYYASCGAADGYIPLRHALIDVQNQYL